jgi:chemotaxis protein CheD
MPRIHRPTDLFLPPGEFFVGDRPLRVRTMLGSCVTITLWHPHRRAGAMSHFLLTHGGPRRPGERLDARYGNEALALMLDGLQALGAPPSECEAKIFGGGDMFGFIAQVPSGTVGRRNGEAARQMLAAHGIAVKREDLFGEGHRQVVFDLADGAVYARQIPRPQALAANLADTAARLMTIIDTLPPRPARWPGGTRPADPWHTPGEVPPEAICTKAFP